jgi:hypothetical protein
MDVKEMEYERVVWTSSSAYGAAVGISE